MSGVGARAVIGGVLLTLVLGTYGVSPAVAVTTGPLAPGTTQQVVRTPDGSAPTSQIGIDVPMTWGGDVSGDGRYVVYAAVYTELVAGQDPDDQSYDVFLYDTATRVTTLISRTAAGAPANAGSLVASISRDGRYVVFISRATDLAGVEQSTPGTRRAYRYDTRTGQLADVNRPALGFPVAMDADGSHLVYEGGPYHRVYRVAPATNTVDLVSKTPLGGAPDGASSEAVVSGDGRYVLYRSLADNILAGTSVTPGIYRWDAETDTTVRVPVPRSAQGDVHNLQISDDGAVVAFGVDSALAESTTANALGYLFRLDLTTGALKQIDPRFPSTRRSVDYTSTLAEALPPSMSADGRYLAFVFHYDVGQRVQNDVVRYDSVTDRTSVVKASVGFPGDTAADGPVNVIERVEISADGQHVLYGDGGFRSLDYLWTASADAPTPPVVVPPASRPRADLRLSGRLTTRLERRHRYTVRLVAANAGPSVASAARVTARLPKGLRVVDPRGGRIVRTGTSTRIRWEIGDVAAGGSRALRVRVMVTRAAPRHATVRARIGSSVADPDASDNRVRLTRRIRR